MTLAAPASTLHLIGNRIISRDTREMLIDGRNYFSAALLWFLFPFGVGVDVGCVCLIHDRGLGELPLAALAALLVVLLRGLTAGHQAARASRMATAGSRLPSRNSRNAPPPVEM